jgi:hypothetical protein
MSVGGLLLLAVFVFFCAAVVLWPVISRREFWVAGDADTVPSTLQAEREATLEALRELEFDYQTGKLAERDYQAQRAVLMARGVEILRQIDGSRESVT